MSIPWRSNQHWEKLVQYLASKTPGDIISKTEILKGTDCCVSENFSTFENFLKILTKNGYIEKIKKNKWKVNKKVEFQLDLNVLLQVL